MIDKKTRFYFLGIFVTLIIILLYVIWYTSSMNIEKMQTKPDYSAYQIEEGMNIILAGIAEYDKAMIVTEGKYKYISSRVESWYMLYFPNEYAPSIDVMMNALEQRLSMGDCFE